MPAAPVAQKLPAAPGAYVLIIELANPVTLTIGRLGKTMLPAGRYAYSGSARGPGGIRARVGRHLRRDKKLHWHIDWLTTAAGIVEARVYPGGDECRLVAEMMALPDTHHPIKGFGSSDCRNCESHLVALG